MRVKQTSTDIRRFDHCTETIIKRQSTNQSIDVLLITTEYTI